MIRTKTLFYIKSSYNLPVRNKNHPTIEICKTLKQKFKRYFLLTLGRRFGGSKEVQCPR